MKLNKTNLLIKILIICCLAIILGISVTLLMINDSNKLAFDIEYDNNLVDSMQVVASTQNENNVVTSRGSIDRTINYDEVQGNSEDNVEASLLDEAIEEIEYKSIDEIEISIDMDLTERCGISKEDFKVLIEGVKADKSKFFYDNSDIIYDLCEKYSINEIFFCGLIAGESGWNIASNHRAKNNYISMMSGGTLIYYPSVEEGLEAATALLHDKYLTPGGAFYSGKTLYCVQKRFCPNSSTWVGLIYGCMSQIV